MKIVSVAAAAALALAGAGCGAYRWTSRVPEELRTVAVPVFQNRSDAAELGPLAAQYLLREFQREGTFSIRRSGDSSIEVQGTILKAERSPLSFQRGYGRRADEYRWWVEAEVSIVNKDSGQVLQDARKYRAETTFMAQGDLLTGQRDAAQRMAADLARQVADDVLSYPYNRR